jgi:electron transfer flavoprotein-quinone oxidoreductase
LEKVEFVVVGAGLSGLAAAMTLAEAGAEVLVVERGDYPGSKNVTGGRLYLGPVQPYLPDIWEAAPLERRISKERLSMVAPNSSITVELSSDRFKQTPHPSYTLLHATFDRWFAEQAVERGALVIPGYKVDDLITEDGRIIGIESSGDKIQANAVVAADGALSFIAERAGLRGPLKAENSAVAAKEVIELPSKTIEERFGLDNGDGVTHLYFGSLTKGVSGGGFLYTNKESLSLGVVLSLHDLVDQSALEPMEGSSQVSPHQILEAFKNRSEIRHLIKDGHAVEYSAHIIPEGGFKAMPRLVTDGLVLVGDAAGLTMNLGITVRGLDFALASGVMAGRALLRAREQRDYSASSLAYYKSLLEQSFVWKDHETFQNMPDFLSNPRLYEHYPSLASDLLEKLLWVGDQPKEKLSKTVFRALRQNLLNLDVIRDLSKFRRI